MTRRRPGAEGGGDLDPAGDPGNVALAMDGIGDVAIVDQQRLQGDARFRLGRLQLREIGGVAAGNLEVADFNRSMPRRVISPGTAMSERAPDPGLLTPGDGVAAGPPGS